MTKTRNYGQTESGRPFLPHPNYEEYQQGLREWEQQCPDRIKITTRGKTLQGNDILLIEVTDFDTPPDDKQVFLYTCTHVSIELNAMTTALHLIKWLLGESELAKETRQKQIVLLMPIMEPDSFVEQRRSSVEKGEGAPCAGYYSWKGVLKPEKNPEALALVGVLDEYLPDVYIDGHGFAQADATMCQSTGVSGGSALVSRTFAPRIIDAMVEAADEAGFGVRATNGEWGGGFMECTGEILCQYRAPDIGPEYDDCFAHELCEHHFFAKESNITCVVYAYNFYHTMATVMEIGVEQCALAQLKKLLEFGNRPWIAERVSGYPVNFMGYGQCVALAGYGQTARQRRESRVEIWRKFSQFSMGYGNPPNRGDLTVVVSTNAAGAALLHPADTRAQQQYETTRNSVLQKNAVYDSFGNLFARLRSVDGFDVDAMAALQSRSLVDRYHTMYAACGFPENEEPLRGGLAIRLLIDFADVTVNRVLMDGKPLAESDTYGYQHWGGSGTIVQVNLPPAEVRELHVIQCDYDMKTQYPCGFRDEDWKL